MYMSKFIIIFYNIVLYYLKDRCNLNSNNIYKLLFIIAFIYYKKKGIFNWINIFYLNISSWIHVIVLFVKSVLFAINYISNY